MIEPVNPDRGDDDAPDVSLHEPAPGDGAARVPLVGLGGAAGAPAALEAFFARIPHDSGLAFAVLANAPEPGHADMLALLRKATRMEVLPAEGRLEVRPGRVFVVPPGFALQVVDGELVALDAGSERLRHAGVDIFFRTLADAWGPQAAAVVLSGVSGDGAIGIKRVKERGGLAVAQDPEEAVHGGMPRAAMATGMVDWVLPVGEMPARLLSYFQLGAGLLLPFEAGRVPAARGGSGEAELRDVLAFLRARTGRDFTHYKRATVLRRIARRMQVNGVDTLPAYLDCLRTRPGEGSLLLQDLLISVTNFFRDPECFGALARELPALFHGKGPDDVVRVWVVACATGEEAYTLAMMLDAHARTLESPPAVQVFATDLDEQAVQAAREGLYPEAIAADVSEDLLRRYFVKEHQGYRVRRELRELVLFAVHDVLKDSPFSRLDLVSCRNLLIYLARETQQRVLQTLHFGLLSQGRLMLGSSESIDDASLLFGVLDKKHRLYVQRPLLRPGFRLLPGAPATLKHALEMQAPPREAPAAAPTSTAELAFAPPRAVMRTAVSWGEVHLQLLEQLAPPSVLVDADHEMLHLSPGAGRFLQVAGGEPSRNLLRALPAAARAEVRAALYRAAQDGLPLDVPGVVFEAGGTAGTADVRIVPLREASHALFLVTFSGEGERTPVDRTRPVDEGDPLADHLDREMERMKLHLRDTVEQYEASAEELKASNEELQAMNEELRAASEELETSREELQSINEELTTVNQELKHKVEQLSSANSDMQNLMDATAIATVFVDRELRITRYTPAAVKLFNLIPTDVGRPLTDLATLLDYPDLGADARTVLDRLVPVEREVGQGDGSWHRARLMPYRTLDDRIAGVVFTFIDISEQRHQADALRASEARVRELAQQLHGEAGRKHHSDRA